MKTVHLLTAGSDKDLGHLWAVYADRDKAVQAIKEAGYKVSENPADCGDVFTMVVRDVEHWMKIRTWRVVE